MGINARVNLSITLSKINDVSNCVLFNILCE